ncbi:glycosyltransferase family 39 protein [Patescibacteria group bacterium]|nr:glycosyltransferase family 39 protein [Patescibacteria group bacterium]
MKINNKATNLLAAVLLIFMLALGFFSILGDSTTMDELAHIPAGYSYIVKKDMRLNPEHPPLLKDLAGLSVLIGSKITGAKINFPDQDPSWQKEINAQWDFGAKFLYQSGNNPDQIVFWARLPMLLIMLLLGFYVFKWSREIYGNKAGLIALFFYSLSPTFLAHGRLVTTDVGAAAAFFIATYYLVKWLKKQNLPNLFFAGIALGLAFLTKFSLVLIIPLFIFLTLAWVIVKNWSKGVPILLKSALKSFVLLALIGIIALALVWPVYLYHTWNYPPDRQLADTEFNLGSYGNRMLVNPVIWMSNNSILRPYGQFFLGVLMVIQRAVGGNTTYFLGEVSNLGWQSYFPIVFLLKVPLALFALILISLIYFIYQIGRPSFKKSLNWFKENFSQFALVSLFILYWATTLKSNLNIGVRHILPTFPVLYVLVSGQITKLLDKKDSILKPLIVLILIWYGLGTIMVYPSFLTYFNELAGGPKNGYKYVTDSNLDWGQDLKRLVQYAKDNSIQTIYVDYFGGDSPAYRLDGKYQPWWGQRNPDELPPDAWLAVSATFLQGGRGVAVAGLDQPTGFYNWLNQYQPVAIIGNSIFVYRIK